VAGIGDWVWSEVTFLFGLFFALSLSKGRKEIEIIMASWMKLFLSIFLLKGDLD
jgi:hypothetical protein